MRDYPAVYPGSGYKQKSCPTLLTSYLFWRPGVWLVIKLSRMYAYAPPMEHVAGCIIPAGAPPAG